MHIKNLIFDLGGVIYEIDYKKVSEGFSQLPSVSGQKLDFSQSAQDPLFDLFETGKITPAQFREGIRQLYKINITDSEIDALWNSMLIGVFSGRKDLLKSLSVDYATCLLSNANQIHYDFIEAECQPVLAYLDKIYFSFQIGMRKPNPEIFKYVLEEMGWLAEETLFIEDSIQHIQGAQSVGIKTLFLTEPLSLKEQLHTIL